MSISHKLITTISHVATLNFFMIDRRADFSNLRINNGLSTLKPVLKITATPITTTPVCRTNSKPDQPRFTQNKTTLLCCTCRPSLLQLRFPFYLITTRFSHHKHSVTLASNNSLRLLCSRANCQHPDPSCPLSAAHSKLYVTFIIHQAPVVL